MAIKKEKNGTYTVDVSLGYCNGKRIRKRKKGIKKLKDAQDIEALIRNDKGESTKKKNISFDYAYSKYINYCYIETDKGNMRNTTIESKKSIFEHHILPFFKNYPLNNISKNDILEFQNILTNRKNLRVSKQFLSNGTIRKIYKQLNAFFEYCVQEEYINLNPCHRVRNFKKEKKEKEYITFDEFNSLIKVIEKKRDIAICYLLFYSGIRISELLGLSLDTINLSDKDPYIKILNTCHKGEIRKYAKTEESQNIVYIDEFTKNVLLEYINSDEFKIYDSIFLFPSKTSKCGILSEKAINNIIKHYCDKAHINKKITPHTFRHGHVAMLMDSGVNLEDIKIRVRHASIKTTSDEYGHMYSSRKKELVSMITNYTKSHSK